MSHVNFLLRRMFYFCNTQDGKRSARIYGVVRDEREGGVNMKYPSGKGLCVVFSQNTAGPGVKTDIDRLRLMCRRLKIDFREEANLSKSALAEVHEKIKATLASYKFLFKIILAKGGLDKWNEHCFFTSEGEYVNVRRDFLVHYSVDKLTLLSDRPDVTVLQLFPTSTAISDTWALEYQSCNILNNVDKAMWCCLLSTEEAERSEGSSFVRGICDTLIVYPDTVLSDLVHTVNYARWRSELCCTNILTTLRAPVVIRTDTALVSTRRKKDQKKCRNRLQWCQT
jgi:hypothetical protein